MISRISAVSASDPAKDLALEAGTLSQAASFDTMAQVRAAPSRQANLNRGPGAPPHFGESL